MRHWEAERRESMCGRVGMGGWAWVAETARTPITRTKKKTRKDPIAQMVRIHETAFQFPYIDSIA